MILTLLACSTALSSGEPLAELLVRSGTTSITRSGTPLDVQTEFKLQKSDILKTGENGMMLVVLPNKHLVRIDTDLELAVSDLAMWKAKPTDVPLQAQLDVLLYEDEHDLAIAAGERIAGWHARVTTAYSPHAAGRSYDGSGESMPSPPAANAPSPPAASTPSIKAKARRVSRPSALNISNTSKSISVKNLEFNPMDAPVATPVQTEAEPVLDKTSLALLPLLSPAKICLVDWLKELGLKHKKLAVTLVIDSDRIIRRAKLEDGLSLPDCARRTLIGRKLPETADINFTIKLKGKDK